MIRVIKNIIRDIVPEAPDPDASDGSARWDIQPGLHSGFGSVDVAYSKSIPPTGDIAETTGLHGWKGERVHCQLLVWSAGREENIRITASGFSGVRFQIDQKQVSISVVKYVLTDEFSGGLDRGDKTSFPVHLKPDRLSGTNCFDLDTPGTRPVWISVDIPRETPAGIYQGTISRQSASGMVNHCISLEVLNAPLPAPSAWSFHLDLWQHPDAVARYGRVALWSPEHFSLLRPMLTLLAQAGQKCITTTLIEEPWSHQTYDDFGGMIKWTQRANGTWTYDYSRFDTKWPSGDAYLVYPDAQSSIRFERLREGVQDYEKIRILREELARNPSAESAAAKAKLNEFMNSMNTKTLDNKSAADVINQGKRLLGEIVRSLYQDKPAAAAWRSKH